MGATGKVIDSVARGGRAAPKDSAPDGVSAADWARAKAHAAKIEARNARAGRAAGGCKPSTAIGTARNPFGVAAGPAQGGRGRVVAGTGKPGGE